jgi:hypothetical protein
MKHRGLTLRSAPESKDALRKGGGKWGTWVGSWRGFRCLQENDKLVTWR